MKDEMNIANDADTRLQNKRENLARFETLIDAFNKHLSIDARVRLKRTCTLFRDEFERDLKRELNELPNLVASSDLSSVKKILEQSPEKLFQKGGEVERDFFGRKEISYKAGLSPFQLAFSDFNKDMYDLMMPFVEKVDNGTQIMTNQYNEIFLNGIIDCLTTMGVSRFDFRTPMEVILQAPEQDVINALNLIEDDSELTHTLKAFRCNLISKVEENAVFNYQLLNEAYHTYWEVGGSHHSWYSHEITCPRRDLIRNQVVGFTQRLLPACHLLIPINFVFKILEQEPLNSAIEITVPFDVQGQTRIRSLGDNDCLGFGMAFICGPWWDSVRSRKYQTNFGRDFRINELHFIKAGKQLEKDAPHNTPQASGP